MIRKINKIYRSIILFTLFLVILSLTIPVTPVSGREESTAIVSNTFPGKIHEEKINLYFDSSIFRIVNIDKIGRYYITIHEGVYTERIGGYRRNIYSYFIVLYDVKTKQKYMNFTLAENTFHRLNIHIASTEKYTALIYSKKLAKGYYLYDLNELSPRYYEVNLVHPGSYVEHLQEVYIVNNWIIMVTDKNLYLFSGELHIPVRRDNSYTPLNIFHYNDRLYLLSYKESINYILYLETYYVNLPNIYQEDVVEVDEIDRYSGYNIRSLSFDIYNGELVYVDLSDNSIVLFNVETYVKQNISNLLKDKTYEIQKYFVAGRYVISIAFVFKEEEYMAYGVYYIIVYDLLSKTIRSKPLPEELYEGASADINKIIFYRGLNDKYFILFGNTTRAMAILSLYKGIEVGVVSLPSSIGTSKKVTYSVTKTTLVYSSIIIYEGVNGKSKHLFISTPDSKYVYHVGVVKNNPIIRVKEDSISLYLIEPGSPIRYIKISDFSLLLIHGIPSILQYKSGAKEYTYWLLEVPSLVMVPSGTGFLKCIPLIGYSGKDTLYSYKSLDLESMKVYEISASSFSARLIVTGPNAIILMKPTSNPDMSFTITFDGGKKEYYIPPGEYDITIYSSGVNVEHHYVFYANTTYKLDISELLVVNPSSGNWAWLTNNLPYILIGLIVFASIVAVASLIMARRG